MTAAGSPATRPSYSAYTPASVSATAAPVLSAAGRTISPDGVETTGTRAIAWGFQLSPVTFQRGDASCPEV